MSSGRSLPGQGEKAEIGEMIGQPLLQMMAGNRT